MANYFGTSKKGAKLSGPAKVGLFVAAGVMVFGGVYGYNVINGRTANKPAPKVNNSPKTTPAVSTPAVETPKKTNYDGTYKGATSVVNGLANAIMTVTGTTTTGTATYNGTVRGMKVSAPVTITGTVSDKGVVTASISGTTTVLGQSIAISGKGNGQITGNSMAGTYSVSGTGFSDSGSITLTKQ